MRGHSKKVATCRPVGRSGGSKPTEYLELGLLAVELWENKFLWFKPSMCGKLLEQPLQTNTAPQGCPAGQCTPDSVYTCRRLHLLTDSGNNQMSQDVLSMRGCILRDTFQVDGLQRARVHSHPPMHILFSSYTQRI